MRKPVRKIVVDGRAYSWLLPGNALDHAKDVHIVVFGSERGQSLQIDPYTWALEIRPKTIAEAIRFALENGWHPNTKGPPLRVGYRAEGFFVKVESAPLT